MKSSKFLIVYVIISFVLILASIATSVTAIVMAVNMNAGTSLKIDENGHLISTSNGKKNDLGYIGNNSEGLLSEVSLQSDKSLLLTFSNGFTYETESAETIFGQKVTNAEIDEDGDFIVYGSGSKATNYGKVEKAKISAAGELILVCENNKNLSLGSVSSSANTCSHQYGEYESIVAASCTSIGYSSRVCIKCGAKDTIMESPIGHKYDLGYGIDGGTLFTCHTCMTVKIEKDPPSSTGLEYQLSDTGESYKVSGIGTCTDTAIIIPKKHNSLPVTEIGEQAFYGCSDIISVTIPETIVKIEDKAFSNCESLTNISMPDNVEIGTDVFRGSINVDIVVHHVLEYIAAKEATCEAPGNIAHYYCAQCDLYYEDPNGNDQIYNVTIPNSHNFSEGVCLRCGAIQNETLITSVASIEHLGRFALGTLPNAIGLPEYITVFTADGSSHILPLSWDTSTYDKSNVGSYTITGHIISSGFYFSEGVSNRVSTSVDIVEHMKGTADIVFILDISGSMGDEISNVKNNVVDFANRLEELGVSSRWSAITYSDSSEYPTSVAEQTTIIQNGANYWFASASDYASAINNINLANGGDTPEMAVDGLMMANELENRKDARVFYILLTDATYKNDNNFGVSNMGEALDIINKNGVNISVITSSDCTSSYSELAYTTGGIVANIYGNFAEDLFESLVPIIYEDVIS